MSKFRRRLMMAGMKPVSTLVPYIRGGADGSYIDTGIIPDNNTRVIVWARNFNPPVASQMLFGYMDSGANTNSFGIGAWGANSCGRMAVYFGDYTNPYTIIGDAFRYLSGYHKYELDGKVLKIDDITIATSASTDTISTVHTIHLFGRNTGGTHTAMNFPADICACKIYKNGVLVRDYTAVNTPSVGLYDAVSDTVFTNAGSGSFTYGTFDENAYTPLEYITCSGAQYFDTGLKGGYGVPWVLVFTPEGTTARFYYPLGARTSTSAGKCAVGVGNSTYVNARLYFHYQAVDNAVKSTNTKNYFTNDKIVFVKQNNVATAYVENSQVGTVTGSSGTSFETTYNMFVGAMNNAGSKTGEHIGKIYYCGLGTYKNYVPAKVNDVAGMYDTYNEVFYPSATETPFVAGPTI